MMGVPSFQRLDLRDRRSVGWLAAFHYWTVGWLHYIFQSVYFQVSRLTVVALAGRENNAVVLSSPEADRTSAKQASLPCCTC